MNHNVNRTKIFWSTLILGLPLLVGIGRLSPDITAIVDTVNRPFHLVSIEKDRIEKLDSLASESQCRTHSAPSELCPIPGITETDSAHVR